MDYNKATKNDSINFADKLTKEIKEKQMLDINNQELQKHPSYQTYQELKENIDISKQW